MPGTRLGLLESHFLYHDVKQSSYVRPGLARSLEIQGICVCIRILIYVYRYTVYRSQVGAAKAKAKGQGGREISAFVRDSSLCVSILCMSNTYTFIWYIAYRPCDMR